MDCIYPEILERIDRKSKQRIITKLHSKNLNQEHNYDFDLFCIVLDYSPKINENVILSKFLIIKKNLK